MKTLHLGIIAVFCFIIFFLSPSDSYASACAVKETIYSAPQFFLLSDSVFAGTVTSITDYGNHQWQVHFDIEKIWKGVATRQTSTVMTGTLQACGYSIAVGEKYLIYTNGSPSFINPIDSKMYSDAQNEIALFDDPQFQSQEKIKEDLNKKLEVAQGRVGSMMMDKSSHIPISAVGVDQVNSTLDIVINDQKATLPLEQYRQSLRDILGDIPIRVEFGYATAMAQILHSVNDHGKTTSYPIIRGTNSSIVLKSPLEQFKSGILAKDVKCPDGFDLVIKVENGSPACVKPESDFKLVQWGWARPINESKYENEYRFNVYPTIDYQNNLLGIQNRTYDFTMLNDTMTKYHNPPLQMTFHGVVFTLLPSLWTGGPIGSCGGYELRADAKFDDGSHEQIGTFVQASPCSDNYTQTNLSIHTNPQVGLSVLHQSVRLLVSSATQTAVQFLHLSLSTNSSHIQYGHAIGIDISLNNTSSDMITIGAASNPSRDDLNTGPCDNRPFGIAILQGFYTQDNMTSTSSIPLFATPPCPLVPSPKSFTFQPLSSQAHIECAGIFSCTGSVTMERHLSIIGSLQYNIRGTFSPGVYTIVGGDEWGHVLIRHFTVTNSSGY